ncbi:MAG: exodeoxyribonuclease VII large subunit [Roseovarius sp.]
MSDLIDDPNPGENAPEFSISELSGAIKRMIEGEFSHVRVKGEVGRVSRPRSGHLYMDLKDDRAVLAGIIWKGVASRLSVQPEEGMEVVATGRLTTFPGQSRYQIVIEDIKPAGVGALMAMLEKRKTQLAGEGLFAPERKQTLPYLPEIIGVVTSPSGAVIRDILHRLRDRFPRKVLIWPVAVQGDKCAPEVTRAIDGFNAFTPGGALPRPDLIIVARGGGSIEDLWGFNEESVVRAAAASQIPLISAVGHETDTTLIDYASDKRAPTPTAAAELAVPVRLDLLNWLEAQDARLTQALTSGITTRGQRLRDLARALPRIDTLTEGPRQRLDSLSERLPAALIRSVQARRVTLSEVSGAIRPRILTEPLRRNRDRLDSIGTRLGLLGYARERQRLEGLTARLNLRALQADLARQRTEYQRRAQRLSDAGGRQVQAFTDQVGNLDRVLQTVGYEATLKRGFAVVRDGDKVVSSTKLAEKAEALEIQFADGRLTVGAGAGAGASHPKATRKKPASPPPEQGDLF